MVQNERREDVKEIWSKISHQCTHFNEITFSVMLRIVPLIFQQKSTQKLTQKQEIKPDFDI